MASESAFVQWLGKVSDKIQEQGWFQQLKAKWDELDPQKRFYIQIGTMGGGLLLILIIGFSFVFSVRSLRSELAHKIELRAMIQNATEELNRLRVSSHPTNSGEPSNYQATVKASAANVGIDESLVEFGPEKAGTSSPTAKETLVEVKLKKLNVRQLVRYAVDLETNNLPIKVRSMAIDAEDPEGYLVARMSLSVFELQKK
jgi:hypothetical protein